ncbi:MAG: heavy metal translocating P-type ATPase [Candidatus Bathyarchaeia archaeon]
MEHREEHAKSWLIEFIAALTLFVIGLVASHIELSSASKTLLLLSALISGFKIAASGLKSALRGNVNINLLVTLASTGAFIIGEAVEGASVLLLFNLAERLEEYAADRARSAIEALMELKPVVASIRRNGLEVKTPVEEVLPGEIFVLKPGDRIPLDGIVVEGASSVDQAPITGESVPVTKLIGDEVYSGSINIDGFLAVKTTKMAEESIISRIVKLVEETEQGRSSTEMFIERFSKIYTPTVLALSALLALVPSIFFMQPLNVWVYRSLVMLVIACPCALAISTPTAMVSAITSAGRNGVLVKGGVYIEKVSQSKVFVFDKTGTLTRGELGVTDIVTNGLSESEVLKRAASLESNIDHPISRAIIDEARLRGIKTSEVRDFKAHTGKGVEACIEEKRCCIGNIRLFEEFKIPFTREVSEKLESEGKTVVMVSEEDCLIGVIAVMDELREMSKETVSKLKEQGMRIIMLTGDNEKTAQAIAERLGIDEYKANLLPEEKVETIESLRKTHGSIIMVGDGINDAPALASADVGVAMGAIGSDVALETADIALMEDNLYRLPYLVRMSRATMQTVKENISVSIFVKVAFAILTLFGLVRLWHAVAIGDMGVSLAVILNSMRLSRVK